jgi:hypothetical protein
MSDETPEEYGRRRAAAAKPIDTTAIAQTSAVTVLITNIYELLVEKQILTQGDAIARLEKVSREIMASDTAEARAHAVILVDNVRNGVAGESKRKPS